MQNEEQVTTEQLGAGLWRLELALPQGFLRSVNLYLIRDPHGFVLVDCGLGNDESWEAISGHATQCGVPLHEIHTVIVTHGHLDHCGLARRLHEAWKTQVWIHQRDVRFMEHRYGEVPGYPEQLAMWLHRYGAAKDEAQNLARAQVPHQSPSLPPLPDRILQGGETISVGDYHFEVQWTPGHTPGHICLYDSRKALLFCGDHVLEDVAPNVSLQPYDDDNPMPRYLDSLEWLTGAGIELALPGHGRALGNIAQRAAELLKHQQDRQQQLLSLLSAEPLTAYELAEQLWAQSTPVNWAGFRPLLRRNALSTVAAHLECLAERGRIQRIEDAQLTYRTP